MAFHFLFDQPCPGRIGELAISFTRSDRLSVHTFSYGKQKQAIELKQKETLLRLMTFINKLTRLVILVYTYDDNQECLC